MKKRTDQLARPLEMVPVLSGDGITPAVIISEIYPKPPKHLLKRKVKQAGPSQDREKGLAIYSVVGHACGTILEKVGGEWLADNSTRFVLSCASYCRVASGVLPSS